MDNGGGAVEATSENAAKTIEGAKVAGTGKDLALELDYDDQDRRRLPDRARDLPDHLLKGLAADSWPSSSPSCSTPPATPGRSILPGIGYVPITGELLTKVRGLVDGLA